MTTHNPRIVAMIDALSDEDRRALAAAIFERQRADLAAHAQRRRLALLIVDLRTLGGWK